MKCIDGWFLPDYDDHFVDPSTYENTKINSIKSYLINHREFVDVGAHIGIWSIKLADQFEKIYAFEPDPTNFECLKENIKSRDIVNIIPYNMALSHYNGLCGIQHKSESNNSGNIEIIPNGKILCYRLDSFYLKNVDLIKIDTQGSEGKIILGAEKTLKINNPVIFLEQDDNIGGLKFLKEKNFVIKEKISSNYILLK